jgi:hypothetical protein
LPEQAHAIVSAPDGVQNVEVDRTYPLPDGRVVIARTFDATGGEAPDRGPMWELQIQRVDEAVIVGHPLNSTLAELLGYAVAHERWPHWIDDLAQEIEASFGGHS